MRDILLTGLVASLLSIQGTIFPSFANAPVVKSSIKPVQIVQTVSSGNRSYFVNFGEAYFGSLSFALNSSAASQSVEVAISEASSTTDIITTAVGARDSTITTTMGSGQKTFSLFNSRPFKACRIKVTDQTVTLDTSSIVLVANQVPFNDSASSFTSSDTVLNRIWKFCKHSVKATSCLGVYIDGVRETKPYEGDAYINMLTHFANDSNPPIALFSHEYLLSNPTWPWEYRLISILIGWELYMANGDLSQLQRNYSALTSRIQLQIQSKVWSDSNALVDWPTNMRDGFDFAKSDVVTNSWSYKAFMTIADIAEALGKSSDATTYRSRAAAVIKAINDSLIIKAQKVYRDCLGSTHVSLHGNLYPLALGLVPDSLKASVAQYLTTRGMVCNVYPAQFLLDGLFDAGLDEYAISLMAAKTGNSWGHMLYQVGSTITMEVWDPSQKSNLDWNHAWGAAPGNVIPRKLFGIMPLLPGYAKIMIKPQVGSLTEGSYALPTVKGTIRVAFQSQKGTSIKITATIPPSTTAKIYVPTYGLSDNTVIVDNKQFAGTREGVFVFVDSIASGNHTVQRGGTVALEHQFFQRSYAGPLMIDSKGTVVRVAVSGNRSLRNASLTIYDCQGKSVRHVAFRNADHLTLALPQGTYIAHVTYEGNTVTSKKFIVRK